MRGIRSGLDKVYLVAPNEEMAKSVRGKIEWLASFGSLVKLDTISRYICRSKGISRNYS